MPSTKELITRIRELAHGWNRTGTKGILPILNDVNRYMMSHDCEQNIYVDPSTGAPPLLSTTEGTFRYSMPSTARKFSQVLIESEGENYHNNRGYNMGLNNTGAYSRTVYYDDTWFKGLKYYDIPVTSRPKTRSTDAYILFRDDPGTTTDRYFYTYYLAPTSITSEAIEVDVEEMYHDLMMDGVLARIRQQEYGSTDEWNIWRNQRIPDEYWQSMNDNQTKRRFIPLRTM